MDQKVWNHKLYCDVHPFEGVIKEMVVITSMHTITEKACEVDK